MIPVGSEPTAAEWRQRANAWVKVRHELFAASKEIERRGHKAREEEAKCRDESKRLEAAEREKPEAPAPKCAMCSLLAKALTELTEWAEYANRQNNQDWVGGALVEEGAIYDARKALDAFGGATGQETP